MKKISTIVILVIFLTTLSIDVVQAEEEPIYLDEAVVLNALGVFDGKSTTSFDPALMDDLTREEGMKLLAEVLRWDVDTSQSSGFDDVSSWAEPYVAIAVKRGVSNGIGNGQFGGKHPVTFQQFYTWILREFSDTDVYDTDTDVWSANIKVTGSVIGIFMTTKDDYTDSINRNHTVATLYSLLPIQSSDSVTTVFDKIINAADAPDVPEAIRGLFENGIVATVTPTESFTRNGIRQVKSKDAVYLTVTLSNYNDTITAMSFAVCGMNICEFYETENIQHLGQSVYSVKVSGILNSGVQYYISSVSLANDSTSIHADRVVKTPFLVVNDKTETTSAVTEVFSRYELDHYIQFSGQRIGIDFYTDWCGYCTLLAPIYEGAAELLEGDVMLLKADGDAIDLKGFDVRGYPTQQFYYNGERYGTITGYMDVTSEVYANYVRNYFE